MAVDYTKLNQTIAALTTQVAKTEGTEESAVALIKSFQTEVIKAVAAALEANDAADQGTIDEATAAIEGVGARYIESADKLGAAVAASPSSGGSSSGPTT